MASQKRIITCVRWYYKVTKLKVKAEIKDYPECQARTKGRFPENMPGPLQYGDGIKSLTADLLISQMLSLNRCTELVHTITGIKMSEATCLNYIGQFHHSLDPYEIIAKEYLLTRPALHVDETGFTQVPHFPAINRRFCRFWVGKTLILFMWNPGFSM